MSTGKLAQACAYCNRKKIKCEFLADQVSCLTCMSQGIECIRRTRKRPRRATDHSFTNRSDLSEDLLNLEKSPRRISGPIQLLSVTMEEQTFPSSRLVTPNPHSTRQRPIGPENTDDNQNPESTTYIGRSHYIDQDTPIDEDSSRAYPSYQSNELTGLRDSVLHMFKAFDLPPRSIRQALIDNFLQFCHPWTPILSPGELDFDFSETKKLPSLLLIQSLFLAASRASASSGVLAFATPEQFYQRAKTLFFVNHEENPLAVIKATIMLQWYTPDGPEHVSYDAGEFWLKTGVGIAYQVGLHKDPGEGRNASMRRRLWWSLVVRDALMSVAHGRPRAINFEDVNVAPLCAADFEDCLACDAESFIHYADICCILGDITESCSRNSLTKSKKEHYQSQIFRWPRVLPAHLRISHLSANNADEYSLCGYDLNTRQLHIPYFISLAILGRPSTRNTISAQAILAASFVAGIFQELLVRDDIGHLAPIFTRYCVASSFFLVSLRPIPELWEACQPDLEVLRLCLKELSKRWKSAIGGLKALESILNTQRHSATPVMKRVLPLTREQRFFFDGFPLDLCHMWTPCTTFYEGATTNTGQFSQYAHYHGLFDLPQGRGIEPIVSTAPFTSADEQGVEVLPLADFLVDGLDNWLSEEAWAV